jgi:hypothetical protein
MKLVQILQAANIFTPLNYSLFTTENGVSYASAISFDAGVTVSIPLELFKSLQLGNTPTLAVKQGSREITIKDKGLVPFVTLFIFTPTVDPATKEGFLGAM